MGPGPSPNSFPGTRLLPNISEAGRLARGTSSSRSLAFPPPTVVPGLPAVIECPCVRSG